jgi:hypothetical protein
VVLPPSCEKGLNSGFAIPPWLRLHTKCLSELNGILSGPAHLIDESCYQAILFLYRLSVSGHFLITTPPFHQVDNSRSS